MFLPSYQWPKKNKTLKLWPCFLTITTSLILIKITKNTLPEGMVDGPDYNKATSNKPNTNGKRKPSKKQGNSNHSVKAKEKTGNEKNNDAKKSKHPNGSQAKKKNRNAIPANKQETTQ